ncbi:hypothetical protein IFM89_039139 [Coptis chinensis]|uniref:Uncharacterized protein n=1 Tax=Coptis chinensis TaxID=261450 RepID=A0A835LDS2_9MAGN|nr:hypothetical protein IFM89_039139 [Coptis chinensis]
MNVDGASQGNPGPSGYGVVFRDSRCHFVAVESRKIGKLLEESSRVATEANHSDFAVSSSSSLIMKKACCLPQSAMTLQPMGFSKHLGPIIRIGWYADSKGGLGGISSLLQRIRDLGSAQYPFLGLSAGTGYPILSNDSLYCIREHKHPLYRLPFQYAASRCEVPPEHTTKSRQAPPHKKRIADSASCSHTILSDSEPPFVQNFAALREWEEYLAINPHLSQTKTMKFATTPKLFPSINHGSDSDDQGVVVAPNLANRPQTEASSSLTLLDSSRRSTSPLRLRGMEKDSIDNRGGYRAKVVSDAHPFSSVKLPTRPLTSTDSALQDPDVASAMFHGAHLPADLAYATDGLTADHCTSLYQSLERASLDSLHLVRAFNLYASQSRRMKAELYDVDGKSSLRAKCDQLLVEKDAARLEIKTLCTEKENLLKSQDKAVKKCLKDREVELQKLYSKEITRVCEEYRKEAEEHTALAVKQVCKELIGPKSQS